MKGFDFMTINQYQKEANPDLLEGGEGDGII